MITINISKTPDNLAYRMLRPWNSDLHDISSGDSVLTSLQNILWISKNVAGAFTFGCSPSRHQTYHDFFYGMDGYREVPSLYKKAISEQMDIVLDTPTCPIIPDPNDKYSKEILLIAWLSAVACGKFTESSQIEKSLALDFDVVPYKFVLQFGTNGMRIMAKDNLGTFSPCTLETLVSSLISKSQ